MSETSDEKTTAAQHDPSEERDDIAEVDRELDDRADGEGLEAEAGRGEETGLAEG